MPLQPERLRQRRQLKGYTQQDMAQAMNVVQQQIARWENGANDPSADAVSRIAKVLDCTSDWLLGLVAEPHAYSPERELSAKEHQLLEMYRHGNLVDMITRLVNELAAANAQKDIVVNSPDKSQIPPD
jgi:transcriptional regulator with XRE-family HTH domain